MASPYLAPDAAFPSSARTLGLWSARVTVALSEVSAIVSGIAFARQGAAVESWPFLSATALLVVE